MRFVTKSSACLLIIFSVLNPQATADTLENILRHSVKANGFLHPDDLRVPVDPRLVVVGKTLFESTAISVNADVSCQNCHLDAFGSADGIPNAVGVGGVGEGKDRLASGGAIVPRNTLPLWGVGSANFDVLFWDGKVDFKSSQEPISQFGDMVPSTDPLEVAVHLPAVEIREMLIEDQFVHDSKTESVYGAEQIYAAIVENFGEHEPEAISDLARVLDVERQSVTYAHVARAIAAFIRTNFAIRETKFHRFVFNDEKLTSEELAGAQVFYGKGKCAVCHSGPYFTDFDFHSVPLPQRGSGKNGFGVDYGRFNVTHDPSDLYMFRTPPLFNVEHTAPYGHSGAAESLESVIVAHFDPLRLFEAKNASVMERTEFYKAIAASAKDLLSIAYLTDNEVQQLIAFLRTLSFELEQQEKVQSGFADTRSTGQSTLH